MGSTTTLASGTSRELHVPSLFEDLEQGSNMLGKPTCVTCPDFSTLLHMYSKVNKSCVTHLARMLWSKTWCASWSIPIRDSHRQDICPANQSNNTSKVWEISGTVALWLEPELKHTKPLVWPFKSCWNTLCKSWSWFHLIQREHWIEDNDSSDIILTKDRHPKLQSLHEYARRLVEEDNIFPISAEDLCGIKIVYSSVCLETFKSYLEYMFLKLQRHQVHLTKEFGGNSQYYKYHCLYQCSLCPGPFQ